MVGQTIVYMNCFNNECCKCYPYIRMYIIYSAGVGRTGTFITIDMVLQQIENEGIIDIPKIINGLRQQRMKMVQTPVSMIIY